jgi:AcrR family transcriptional regulator
MAESGAEAGPVGLREQKKARTRALIREHALRLFGEQGFRSTTVERISAAAEVSAGTFFRYFPSKDDIITDDGLDALVIESFREQPPGLPPVAAIRAAVASTLDALPLAEQARLCSSARIGMALPHMGEFTRTIEAVSEEVAQRAGRDHGDFTDRILAGAVIGAILAAALPEPKEPKEPTEPEKPDEPGADLPARFDAALAYLETGLS